MPSSLEPQATRWPRLGKLSKASGTRGARRLLHAVERRPEVPHGLPAGRRVRLRSRCACSRLRATAVRHRFFANGETALPSLPALPKAGAGKRDSLMGLAGRACLLITLLWAVVPVSTAASPAGDMASRIDAVFADWNGISQPGMSVAVVQEGSLIYSKGFGAAQLEYDIPITPTTIFHVASVSKQFTAMAIMLLDADGKLSIDDEVQKYLPWVPRFEHPVTIRQLANHTSGIRDQWELLVMAGWRFDDVITMDDIRTMMERQRELNFEPGSEMLYCNMGYTLMAEIVAAVSGQSFLDFTRERIFEPLGMAQTHFHVDHEEIVRGRAYSYQLDDSGDYKKSVLSYANVGATSLFTTAADLGKWLDNFRTTTVGDESVMAKMLEMPALPGDEAPAGTGYAAGLSLGQYRGLKTVGHGGADAGFRSQVTWFPKYETGIAVLSNSNNGDPGGHATKVADILLEDFFTEDAPQQGQTAGDEEVVVDPALLQSYSGAFSIEIGGSITFEVEDGQLFADIVGIAKMAMTPVSQSEFLLPSQGAKIKFISQADGQVDSLELTFGGGISTGRRLKNIHLSDEELTKIAGRYYSPELRYAVDVVQNEDGLMIRHDRHGDIHLSGERDAETGELPGELGGDRWFCSKVKFEFNEQGEAVAMRTTGGRVRNLLFERLPM